MRKYQAVWERLKNRDTCVLADVHPGLARRIKRGIIKEKNKDLSFKVMNDLEQFRLVIQYDSETRKMKLFLKGKFGIVEKVVA